MTKLFFILYLFFSIRIPAQESKKSSDVMNGYRLSDYKDFEKKWKLITVRYRKDTGEMRFTYANDLAYKNLMKNTKDYPDGSVFAKVGIKTLDDPAFISSAVPAGARRYQLMVRNKQKHTDTDGWGYALFDAQAMPFPEPQGQQVAACAACHRIVPERNYVFSQLMESSPLFKKTSANQPDKSFNRNIEDRIPFKEISVSELPKPLQSKLVNKTGKVRIVNHEITQAVFQGTLDEIRPTLSREAARTKKPAILLSDDHLSFSLVYVENEDSRCQDSGKTGIYMKAIISTKTNEVPFNEINFCWTE